MFRINCDSVNTVGESYIKKADQLKSIKGALMSIQKDIEGIWGGGDSYNFSIKFDRHAQEVSKMVAFFENNGQFLVKCAEAHDELDIDFGNAMSS